MVQESSGQTRQNQGWNLLTLLRSPGTGPSVKIFRILIFLLTALKRVSPFPVPSSRTRPSSFCPVSPEAVRLTKGRPLNHVEIQQFTNTSI